MKYILDYLTMMIQIPQLRKIIELSKALSKEEADKFINHLELNVPLEDMKVSPENIKKLFKMAEQRGHLKDPYEQYLKETYNIKDITELLYSDFKIEETEFQRVFKEFYN